MSPSLRTVQYAYDTQNRWIKKSLDADGDGPGGAVDTHFVYDGNQIVLQFDDAGDLTNRYLWGPAVDQILADEQVDDLQTPGTVLWPATDHLGTVRDLMDDTGAVLNHIIYDGFGSKTSESNAAIDHLFGFTGRPFDEATGLQNNLHRWYDTSVGRWLSEDPIGFDAEDANLYRYVGNGPVVNVDPSGLCFPGLADRVGRWIGHAVTQVSDWGKMAGARVAPEMSAPNPASYRSRDEWWHAHRAHLRRLTMRQRWELDRAGLIWQGEKYWILQGVRDFNERLAADRIERKRRTDPSFAAQQAMDALIAKHDGYLYSEQTGLMSALKRLKSQLTGVGVTFYYPADSSEYARYSPSLRIVKLRDTLRLRPSSVVHELVHALDDREDWNFGGYAKTDHQNAEALAYGFQALLGGGDRLQAVERGIRDRQDFEWIQTMWTNAWKGGLQDDISGGTEFSYATTVGSAERKLEPKDLRQVARRLKVQFVAPELTRLYNDALQKAGYPKKSRLVCPKGLHEVFMEREK